MEHPEDILHMLEEFSKLKPKEIPRELEDYLCFVARTGDPVYQWPLIKALFREKLVSVITEFCESCPTAEIPTCRNVDVFSCDSMKNFILEKLDTFTAAPFTVQRICELLTTPRKEYNRIDKYMRALEKNILVVSTTEPGNRRYQDRTVNGLELERDERVLEASPEMDFPWRPNEVCEEEFRNRQQPNDVQNEFNALMRESQVSNFGEEQLYVSIEPVAVSESCLKGEKSEVVEEDVTVTITPIPAGVQKRRNSIEPVVVESSGESSDNAKPVEGQCEQEQHLNASTSSEVSEQPSEAVDSTTTTTVNQSDEKLVDSSETMEHIAEIETVVLPCVELDLEKTEDSDEISTSDSFKLEIGSSSDTNDSIQEKDPLDLDENTEVAAPTMENTDITSSSDEDFQERVSTTEEEPVVIAKTETAEVILDQAEDKPVTTFEEETKEADTPMDVDGKVTEEQEMKVQEEEVGEDLVVDSGI